MAVNAERGEVEVSVGGRRLTLAVTMDGLARLSTAIGARGLDDINNRLSHNEPFAVREAVEIFGTDKEVARKAAAAMKPVELFDASAAVVAALLIAFEVPKNQGNAEAAGESG
ncbi:hypothetical protein [Pleomorphomonas oryzae]|uniref:hypothetical protein n=1 Tax=Pleomorphomonas oryzae TaxID=261934 RepID=UPI0003F9B7F3|nr:hypothetical protein [Pleomorphomonas oryzae]